MSLVAYQGQFFTIEFFQKGNSYPADEFLKVLDVKVQARAYALFVRLADHRMVRNKQKFRILEGTDGIFEFKPTDQLRILCFFTSDRRVILTNAFIKKSNKTPQEELIRAESYKKDFYSKLLERSVMNKKAK